MSERLCVSCGIAAARVLRRTGDGIIASPEETLRPGHVMAVSAFHATSFSELTAEQAHAFMTFVAEAAADVERETGAERCYVLRIGDQSPHLHFHLIPRLNGEPPLGPFIFGDTGWGGQFRK